ncbi:MAG: acyltransferase family protein, partial [Candidatus Helarchaeota archaeon]|nr:acyltransferase family protein [Candidatus Helarchaeota archaeon]
MPIYGGAEGFRFISAIMIVLYHIVIIFYPLDPSNFWIIERFWMFTHAFFVLTGFGLMAGYSDRINMKTVKGILIYLERRAIRIIPLFYSVLFIWMIIRIYYPINFSIIPISTEQYLLTFSLFFNVFPYANQDIVLGGWAVSPIFLFYLIFPILIIGLKKYWIAIPILIITLLLGTITRTQLFIDGAPFYYSEQNLICILPFFI